MKKPDGMSEELYELILNTTSMDDKERQYWFDTFSDMGEDQKERFFNILNTEKTKLEELEKKFEKEMQDLVINGNKYIIDDFNRLNLSFIEKLKILFF